MHGSMSGGASLSMDRFRWLRLRHEHWTDRAADGKEERMQEADGDFGGEKLGVSCRWAERWKKDHESTRRRAWRLITEMARIGLQQALPEHRHEQGRQLSCCSASGVPQRTTLYPQSSTSRPSLRATKRAGVVGLLLPTLGHSVSYISTVASLTSQTAKRNPARHADLEIF